MNKKDELEIDQMILAAAMLMIISFLLAQLVWII